MTTSCRDVKNASIRETCQELVDQGYVTFSNKAPENQLISEPQIVASRDVKPQMDKRLLQFQAELQKVGLDRGNSRYWVELGRKIFRTYSASSQKEKEEVAACLKFSISYLTELRNAGVSAAPLLKLQNHQGKYQRHVMVGLVNPQTGKVEYVANIRDHQGKSHFEELPRGKTVPTISDQKLLFYDLHRIALTHPDRKNGEAIIDSTLKISPDDHILLSAKAYFAFKQANFETAIEYYLKSIAAYPPYPEAYLNICTAAQRLGKTKLIATSCRNFNAIDALTRK